MLGVITRPTNYRRHYAKAHHLATLSSRRGARLLSACESPTAPLDEAVIPQAQTFSAVEGRLTDDSGLSPSAVADDLFSDFRDLRAKLAKFDSPKAAEKAGYVHPEHCVSNPFWSSSRSSLPSFTTA